MKDQTMKSFLHAVHFLICGHSKTFTIKEGGCHTQDFVGIVDFMQVSEQVRRRLLGLQGVSGVYSREPCNFVPFHLWSRQVAGFSALWHGGCEGEG
jgi:hypothetical protein